MRSEAAGVLPEAFWSPVRRKRVRETPPLNGTSPRIPVDFRSPPIVSRTRGFPCVYREPGGSLGSSVAGRWQVIE